MSTRTTAAEYVEEDGSLFVFHGRRLRKGERLDGTARFSDASWPLAPVTLQGQERGLVLHFDTVPERYRHALKRLCYLSLSGPLPPGEPRPRITSILGTFYKARTFLRWLDSRQPSTVGASVDQLSDVSADHLTEYQRHLLTKFRGADYRRGHRSAVQYFWRYREALGSDGLSLDPRKVADWNESYTGRRGENTTDRIPEAVHSRLLVWAIRFVDEFSSDILHASTTWQLQHARGLRHSPVGKGRNSGLADQIHEFMEAAARENRSLPGSNGRVSINGLARLIGCAPKSLERHQDAITAAVEKLGVSEFAQLNVPISGRIEGQSWLDGISVEPSRNDSLSTLAQMLQAACYIVIAFLSGMRDSEVKHLRRGCVSVRRDSGGNPYRWHASGLAFKGEQDEAGVTATWTIGDAAARAIAVLEQLQPVGTDWLFGALSFGPGAGSGGRGGNTALTVAGTNRQLNRFLRWVNDYCQTHDRDEAIPAVDGKAWNLTTRQFRRTLAWYIARRPGGAIAGAIAYRHHSIQMFEGYAGTSDSGFRAEVEAEEALARAEHLLAMIDHHEHASLAGPSAAEAHQRLAEFGDNARFAGAVITDRHRLQRLMKRNDPAVYPGRYVTCVYDHTKAQCKPKVASSGAGDRPDLTKCRPLACRNVALTETNVEAWREELSAIQRDLTTRPLLPPYLQASLELREGQIRTYLARNQEAPQ